MDSGNIQTLAERFEDEKRRIIDSCFAKREEDGSLSESYITHVKVIEDSQYPSSPPPPDSPSQNKKPRVIMVSVRKSGRVRIHKGRENTNGTFSIGKTWPLDDLGGIQNFVGLTPANTHEQQAKQWASSLGFIVTLGKPYYWQASTSKEKDFFIASLIKIFRKYTGGRSPDLVGFTSHEIQQLTGSPTSRAPSGIQSGSQASLPAPVSIPEPLKSPPRSNVVPEPRLSERVLSDTNTPRPSTAQTDHSRPQTSDSHKPPSFVPPIVPIPIPTEIPTPRQESFRSRSRENSSGQAPLPPSHRSRPSQDGSAAYANRSMSATPRPSVSPRSSHSSLQPDQPVTTSQSFKTSALQPPPIPNEAGLRKLGVAPSVDSLRSGDSGTLGSSRPSTATSEQKPPPAIPPIQRELESQIPQRTKPVPLFSQESRAIHNEVTTSHPDLPLTTASDRSIGANSTDANIVQSNGLVADNRAPPTLERSNVETATPAQPELPKETDQLAEAERTSEDTHRPGLGPMVKKKSAKEIASTFRKAAFAATAFQPRQGGAGARFRLQPDGKTGEPDGITSVVPAPLLRGASNDSATPSTADYPTPGSEKDRPFSPSLMPPPKVQLQRTATDDSVANARNISGLKQETEPPILPESPEKTREQSPERRRKQRQETEVQRYCSTLGLDPKILDGQGTYFNELLTEFGWDGKLASRHKLDDFEADIRREVGRAQATGWLGHIGQQDSMLQDLSKAFDKAIEECEELDGLLTLYAHELDTLNEDIQYIEAQSQGLQVQTANQKLLQKELHSLLQTLNVSSSDLKAIHSGSLESTDGVMVVENALSTLYQAMLTIDPEIRQNKLRQINGHTTNQTDTGVYADPELGQMRAVREKKEDYREQTLAFLRRFSKYMTHAFKVAEQRTSEDNSRSSASNSTTSLALRNHTSFRQELWIYNTILLFVREVNSYEWNLLINNYEINIKSTYQEYFTENSNSRKKIARQPVTDEQDILFTAVEREDKHEGSLASSAARKLTVRRGRAVKATALRQALRENKDGKQNTSELFDGVLQDQAKAISEEQNFLVLFFHLNSQSSADFAELVSSRPPQQRRLPNLNIKQPYDPDRNMSKIVQNTIEGIFSFWPDEMVRLLDWCVAADALQSVGVLCALEQNLSTYEETNQEFITRVLRQLHEKVTALFHKFIDEQVKAIEETKVKVKKRKGIISFIRIFPLFSAAVEALIPASIDPNSTHHESLEVRFIVNDAYTKILKAMWESLNFIAKDNANSASAANNTSTNPITSTDPDDKEALNYHILLIENMNHFVEEVDPSSPRNIILDEWRERASHDFYTHLTAYTDSVIRRPLGKWLDFLESTEPSLLAAGGDRMSSKPSHSRSAAKKLLGAHDVKEIRKGIETLKKRVEKHFADVGVDEYSGDNSVDGGNGRTLVSRVLEECSGRYVRSLERMKVVLERVYEKDGKGLEIEWRKEDVVAAFRR